MQLWVIRTSKAYLAPSGQKIPHKAFPAGSCKDTLCLLISLRSLGHIVNSKSLRNFADFPPATMFSMSVTSSLSIISLLGAHPYYKLTALFFGVVLFRQWKKRRIGNPNGLPLPPGPKGYPLIGNIFDMAVDKPWVVYDEWRGTYGKTLIINVCSPQITGRTIR